MIRCRDCKHWLPAETYEYFDAAAEDMATTAHRLCGRIKLLDHFDKSVERLQELAFTRDGSGYMAELWTLPEFGCALGEPSEVET